MLVSVSQGPYFKVFKGKNLPERKEPAVFHPKTNELTGVLLSVFLSSPSTGSVEDGGQGGKKLLFSLITVFFI